jgi:hypothetical protein
MAKKEQQEARGTARDIAKQSKQDTRDALHGAPGGAFGSSGLTGDRTAAQGQRDTTLGNIRGYEDELHGYQDQTKDWSNKYQSKFEDYANTGGVDPGQLAKLRTGYEGFANTGGFTPEQEAGFRRSASGAVPAAYDVMMNEARRKRALTGGLGGGGELSQMTRQLGETSARANTAGEVALADQERQGKLAGLSGLGGVESQLASNKLSGIQGGANVGQAGIQMGSNLSQAGANMEQNLYNSQTGEISQMGSQILQMLGIDQSNQSLSLQTLQSLANTPGLFDNIMKVGGLAVGGLTAATGAGMLGGVGKIGGTLGKIPKGVNPLAGVNL